MTTILAQAQKDPIIPFVPVVKFDDYTDVILSLERYDAGTGTGRGATGHWTKLKEKAIFCAVPDLEYIIRTIYEFSDVASEDRLDLDTPQLKFKYFRQCLGAEVRTAWDNAKDGKPESNAGWNQSLVDFLANYFKPSDLNAQKKYMEHYKKNHSMSVKTVSDRFFLLNKYMGYFPGSGGNNPYDDTALKNIFFESMPDTWQIDFAKAGHDINLPTYTYQQLQSYMANHAVLSSVMFDSRKNKEGRGGRFGNLNSGGRGHGRSRGSNGGRGGSHHNDNNSNKRSKETCSNHPNGSHTWWDCKENPKSAAYRALNSNGGRNNNGGRGNGDGRGGRGRNNYSNNRGNQGNNNNNRWNQSNNNSNSNDNFHQDQVNQGSNNNNGNNNRNNNNGNTNRNSNNGNNNRNNSNNGNNNNQGNYSNNNAQEDNHWMDSMQW